MAAVVDGPSALRAFLAALNVPQHESAMVQLGFGDITAFAGFGRCQTGPLRNARYTLPSVRTWGVMSAPGDRREVVMPQVGPTWGCESFCEPPVRPHPSLCPG